MNASLPLLRTRDASRCFVVERHRGKGGSILGRLLAPQKNTGKSLDAVAFARVDFRKPQAMLGVSALTALLDTAR
jgi:hypothetical protein